MTKPTTEDNAARELLDPVLAAADIDSINRLLDGIGDLLVGKRQGDCFIALCMMLATLASKADNRAECNAILTAAGIRMVAIADEIFAERSKQGPRH